MIFSHKYRLYADTNFTSTEWVDWFEYGTRSQKTELADVRQEVNELTRYDRLSQLASSQGMKLQKKIEKQWVQVVMNKFKNF